MLKIGNRSLGTVLRAPFERRHYIAAANIFRVCRHPFGIFRRYFFGGGKYPCTVEIDAPLGRLALRLYCPDDILTVNEIFCRLDYPAAGNDSIIVDFGSNIGISAAYFLSRGADTFVYLFEPLPQNLERLETNLREFRGRFALAETAVGLYDGTAEFGWEETGRYGGVGAQTGRSITVECIDSNKVLARIIEKHGCINILKIDVETLEPQIIARMPVDIARKIRRIYVEYQFSSNPLAKTHTYHQYGSVAHFRAFDRAAP